MSFCSSEDETALTRQWKNQAGGIAMKLKAVFYSMYGHIYRMAEAVAEGAREVQGAEVELLQVPELMPEEILERSGD